MEKVRAYLEGQFKDVEGWCIPHLWQSIQPIHEVQKKNDIDGPIAEIGVLLGKFFIGLLKSKEARPAFAIDVFSMQRFNLDKAGRGNLAKFQANIEMCGESLDGVRCLERDSTALTRKEIDQIREESGGFSMFSIDGCHTAEHTINDIRVAMDLTVPGGIIFVDDYYNANWPGVQEGVCKLYLNDSPVFQPLLSTCNKLILCHVSYHAEYLEYVADFIGENFKDTRVKRVSRFGIDNLTVGPNMTKPVYLAAPEPAPQMATAAAA